MSRAAQTKAKKSVRLELACVIEGLESRFLLTGTPVTWTGTTGNWNVAANWSTNAVPDGTDDVTIPTGADVTVSDTESADSVTTATGSTLEVVSGGTLNLGADPSTVNGSLDIGGTIGTIAVGSGTLTLVGTTTWTGGAINLQQSKVINAASGVMNLSGTLTLDASGQIFGTLENLGTINQSSGTLTFNEVSAIDNFGTYDITGDANLVSTEFLGAFAGTLVNETGGLFEKTGGTGDSTVSPALINNGTIQAGSGQLSLTSTTLTQIQVPTYSNTDGTLAGMPVPDSNLTITGGTFAAVNGATLNLPSFPAGDSVTANQGTLIVNGVGSNITGISNLNRNSGDMTIENGADYTTAGDFINDGDLDIGQGSTFDVMGGYTQTSGGTLTVQVGGTATGDYGTLNSTDVATLGGTLDTVILNTYTPSNGDNFNIITYPGEGGSFSATTTQGGGSFSFTPSLGNTGVSIAASVDTTPP
ncbi:MAG: G8 domain-containing protein, partial [Tepidisphaeraceae bacterium]